MNNYVVLGVIYGIVICVVGITFWYWFLKKLIPMPGNWVIALEEDSNNFFGPFHTREAAVACLLQNGFVRIEEHFEAEFVKKASDDFIVYRADVYQFLSASELTERVRIDQQ